MTIVYEYHKNLYVNLTNRCTNSCPYCIKYKWKGKFRGNDLYLKVEPAANEIISAIKDPKKYGEIVFCGYGEPLIKLDVLKDVAKWAKDNGGKVRINTSGQANLYHKRNIVPELKGLVDAVSISLNGTDPESYDKINKSLYGNKAFDAILEFTGECKKYIPENVITAVELPGLDISGVKQIADNLGVIFRSRPYLDEYENH